MFLGGWWLAWSMRFWPRVGCLLQSDCVYSHPQAVDSQWLAFIFIFFEDFPCFVGSPLAMSRQLHDATANPKPPETMKTTTTSIFTFHILHRTGGVYYSYRGTIDEAIAEVARRNATDCTRTTEMVSSYSDEQDMMDDLAYYRGQLD